MIESGLEQTGAKPVETVLREELALGDAMLTTSAGVIRHLLANDDSSIFSDQVIARVRGMLADVARQLVLVAFGLDDLEEREDGEAQHHDLTEQFLSDPRFLEHAHALALEHQLAERLQARNSIDPVVSSLLQSLIADKDRETAEQAMGALAAQARYVQYQRRMELPLAELPPVLRMAAVDSAMAHIRDGDTEALEALQRAPEGHSNRIELLTQLVEQLGQQAHIALTVHHAGASIFLTALAMGAGQTRELATLATTDRQLARLALSLRAAGMRPDAIEEQFVYLHPDVTLPPGFDRLRADQAAALLAQSSGMMA